MRYLSFVLLFFFLFQSSTFAQWVQQTNGLPETWYLGWSIDACDSNCAVISVDMQFPEPPAIYLTKNGGNMWENISPICSSYETLFDISIIDKNHIWVVSERIFATTDGGENWSVQFFDTNKTKSFNYIEMFDLRNGIAMGDAPNENGKALFLQTTDGGITWHVKENSISIFASFDVWRMIDFVDIETGYFTQNWWKHKPRGFFKTTDGGNDWITVNEEASFYILKFYDENIGLTTKMKRDSNGTPIAELHYRTTDGGNTWNIFEQETFSYPEDLEFIPNTPEQIWYLYSRDLLFSNDTGRTWTEQTIPVENFGNSFGCRDIVFTDSKHGWILCDDGKLFYTNNNGGIVTEVEKGKPNTLPIEFGLKQNYPNPFNPITTINYSIPVLDENIRPIQLKVYDVLGKEIATLVNEEKQSGNYSVEFNAENLSSGIYYYQLKTKNFVKTKKMVLLR